MIQNKFDKTVLVENVQVASMISKEEDITAVTNEGEVFYPGSYRLKMGGQPVSKSKLKIYLDIYELNQ